MDVPDTPENAAAFGFAGIGSILARVMADITRRKHLNPRRRHRTG